MSVLERTLTTRRVQEEAVFCGCLKEWLLEYAANRQQQRQDANRVAGQVALKIERVKRTGLVAQVVRALH